MGNANNTNARDTNGQYIHADDVMCRCGHSVGQHTAASHKGSRDCLWMGPNDESCPCNKVRKVKLPK